MDQNEIVKFLTRTIDSFVQDQLINKEQRIRHKEQCAERLAAEDGASGNDSEVQYSDQAVLANLDWGIEALEEAINTFNEETKLARLEHAEKMLQVCAMLNSNQKTAGVPNFYLSAWAHLNLSYLWKLRDNIDNSVLHILEMFSVDPFFSRIDFAPELWKILFLPHMNSIFGWYSQERQRLVMEVIPDSSDLSFTADLDQFFNESLVFTMRPDQLEKLQKLEQLYGETLDENTRLYAKYYKECMQTDSTVSARKVIPMLPIVEPPMTPLHEVSRSIPDYVKFGPILPKNAGFSPILRSIEAAKEESRMNASSSSSLQPSQSDRLNTEQHEVQENEDESDREPDDSYMDLKGNTQMQTSVAIKMNVYKETDPRGHSKKVTNQVYSPRMSKPIDSPKNSKIASPNQKTHGRKETVSLMRLLSTRVSDSMNSTSLPSSPQLSNDHSQSISSPDSDNEEVNSQRKSYISSKKDSPAYDSDGCQSSSPYSSSDKRTARSRPPKDFVCPITGHLFSDPVTLETGQTYERKAIQEWLKRGNTTCPITRQPLSATELPQTNYVLKRLITSWKEQYPDIAQEYTYSETPKHSFSSPSSKEFLLATPSRTAGFPNHKNIDDRITQRSKRFGDPAVSMSPTSVISQAAVEAIMNSMKPHISCLCTSESLHDCEAAVLAIARLWKDSEADPGVYSCLSKPTIINGFVEILGASLNREVLRTTICILSHLIFADERVRETLTSVDSDIECLAALLKNGLAEAAVLIYQLKPVFAQLSAHDLIPSLVQMISNLKEELVDQQLVMDPKDAAIGLLEQILLGGDENNRSLSAITVVSENGIPALVKCLRSTEGRVSVISILLCCMQAEKCCRSLIAERIDLTPVLESFHAGNDSVRGICIDFLSELVQLNRRAFCNKLLQKIKDEGAFSTMHTFLVYLQMAPMDHQLATATLLLQLDLLVDPRKMSIYREEAVETLIEALRQKDFSNYQMKALDSLVLLTGRLTTSGKPCTEAWLLKVAGVSQPYDALMKTERIRLSGNEFLETVEEDEKAMHSWQKRLASVLCNHEKGAIFKALEECFRSNSLEIAKSGVIVATWLTHMLFNLPDTGVRDVARSSLLEQFIHVLQSSKNQQEKILATLALKSFISYAPAIEALGTYAKTIYKILRKLKRNTFVATEIMKALMNLPSVDATELWNYTEVTELDASTNGEVHALLYLKGRILSGHSDGTIKIWESGRRVPRLIQEFHEHTKAVTCFYVPPSGDKLYSGSLDKTIRVWTMRYEDIRCIQVHDVKEVVYELTADSNMACYVTQGTGVKVYYWSGITKQINLNKYVKCLAMSGDNLYCGCSGHSIQEVDLPNHTIVPLFSGARKLLSKQTIYTLQIHDDVLFAGGSSVDSIAGKIFSMSSKAIIGTFSTTTDIHHIAINHDFIFTASRCGIIEVWLKERFSRVGSIKPPTNGYGKITSLTTDPDAGMLFAGFSDGKIQVWALD